MPAPTFVKLGTYFPCTAKLCINGNEWAKRQAAKAGISQPVVDCLQPIGVVDRGEAVIQDTEPAQIDALLRKWLAIPRRCGAAASALRSPGRG